MNPTPFRLLTAALALAAVAPPLVAGPPVDTSFLKRYAETRGFMLGRPTKPKFTPDGKAVLFLRAAGPTTPRQTLFEFDVATGKTRELLTPEMLLKGGAENVSPEEKARRERQRVSTGGFADYHLDETGGRVLVTLSGRPWVFDRLTGRARELNAGPGTVVDPKWSPDGKFISYVRGHDVMAYDLASDKELSVTTGGTAEKTHGLAEFVAQEEMDRHTGYWWSPDSKFIAYEEADHAGVEVWHIADPFKPGVAPQPQYYPRPGKKNVSVRLGVVPVAGGPTVWVQWDRAKFEYLAAVRWDKTGPLTLQLQTRDQRTLDLLSVDAGTGLASRLIRSTDKCWVNIRANEPNWLSDGKGFLWTGESGTNYLEWLRPDGSPHETIRESETRVAVIELNGDVVLLHERNSTKDGRDPTSDFLYTVCLRPEYKRSNWNMLPLVSDGAAVRSASLGRHPLQFLLTTSKLHQMPETVCYDQLQPVRKATPLPSVAAEPPFKPNVTVQKVDDYWTAVIRPRAFDPKKKYPVIVDVYGGPHHLHVQQAMRNWLIPQWLADQGFVVVAIDGRGTPGRGRDWERAIYQKLGTVPLEDQVKGLHALCDRFPELDRDRVGVVGWSFGGYMAANGVLRRPDVFKAAVAGAPVTDWEDYDTHYTERYLGLLPESRKAYDDASLLPLAKNLSRPLLLVHGTADDNVYYRHSLKLADALFRTGREFETLPLPGVTHMYSADPQVAERLWERAVLFFKRHLGEAK